MDGKGRILEEIAYDNTLADVKEFAGMVSKVVRTGTCNPGTRFVYLAPRQWIKPASTIPYHVM